MINSLNKSNGVFYKVVVWVCLRDLELFKIDIDIGSVVSIS